MVEPELVELLEKHPKLSDIDLAFVVDATTSGAYKKVQAAHTNIYHVIEKIRSVFRNSSIRFAFIAYRDYSEGHQRFEVMDFTEDLPSLVRYINNVKPISGFDIPEDVVGALNEVLKLNWTSANKMFFQIGR